MLGKTSEFTYPKELKPNHAKLPDWESYSANLETEYIQSTEEGLDLSPYKDLFAAAAKLPKSEFKAKLGDLLFEAVQNASYIEGYQYVEPSTLDEIKKLRKTHTYPQKELNNASLEQQIHGAWLGRICGCLLGKTVEGIKTTELIPFLKETDNYPMHRYIHHADLNDEICSKYSFPFAKRCFADTCDGMPVDDDTNYMVLAYLIIKNWGRNFTSQDVANAWLRYQRKDAYCTAERVAFCNFIKGYEPPASAFYQNPYREWIGAQIRGDYFGYINPGNPELAAEMAFRDASISHIKNGIYGEMFIAAMIACAAVTTNIEDIILGGLAEIPHSSRLYEQVTELLLDYHNGTTQKECFTKIHTRYNEHNGHDWCHTISNALIVVASLLYGNGDYGKSICMSVEAGFDTDCNGATVGSILGMAFGLDCIEEVWSSPIQNRLHTSIFGVGTVNITDMVQKTMEHLILE